ncbi:hypothetical protein CPter291_0451 [Collimonas pratensis]|uniref:Uncharacterized protein n=1 Tax=Collimonas pratensis TaxID=279113 RepID=A0ABM5Z146_9BURK|nr:hypothetical protein CPter291_0451 [Collimonas pratensis]
MRFMKDDATHYSGTAPAFDKGMSSMQGRSRPWQEYWCSAS